MMTAADSAAETYVARATILRIALASGGILALYFSLMALAIWGGEGTYTAFLPLVILVLGLLASSLVRLGLRGRYADPLSRSALAAGLAGAFLAFLFGSPDLDALTLSGVSLCTAVALILSLSFFFSHQRRRKLALRALAITLVGLTVFLASGLSNLGPVQSLGPVALASGLVTALVSLFPLMTASKSRYLRLLASGAEGGSNVIGFGIIVFLLVSYVGVIRPLVGSQFPQALSIVEWSMVVVAFAMVGWTAYRYLKSVSGKVKLGDWKVLGNDVRRDRAELGPASEAVKEFVEDGKKEGLLLLVASVLEKNSVDATTSKRIVGRIVEYHEDESRLISARSDARRKTRLTGERMAMVQEVLRLCTDATENGRRSNDSQSSLLPKEGGSKVGDR